MASEQLIKPDFVQTTKTVALARSLLGKFLVRRMPDGRLDGRMITETGVYVGEKDLAAHSSKGRTLRTEVMYRSGGVWYVYLCYGIHEMLNLVTGPEGSPTAILIRGVDGAIGPGRLTKTLSIDRALNAASALDPSSGLLLEDRGVHIPRKLVHQGPRVGVSYAVPIWAPKPWRFWFFPERLKEPA